MSLIIVDAHQDIAYNAVCFGRDYRRSALLKRQFELTSWVVQKNGYATIGLPEAIAGRVAVVFATLFVAPYTKTTAPWYGVMYRNTQEAYRLAMQQLDYYERITDEDDRLMLVRTQTDLDAVLATWAPDKPVTARQQGLVLLMESADPIIEPSQFEEWVERGVRVVGPAWNATRYSGGTGTPGPLTTLGYELLDVMADFKTVLDLSHMAEDAYMQAIEHYTGPIIASHSNPRIFSDTDRHLSDAMIRALAERDGVIGAVLYNHFLDGTWTAADKKHRIYLSRVADVIDHICQVTGSVAHVGIGSDFDGGFGAESVPVEVDTVADLWRIQDTLRERGFSEDDISAIMGGNMLRKLREGLT